MQVLLDTHVLRRARQRAAEQGIPLGEYIRRLVERDLHQHWLRREPSVVFNLGDSGGADVANEKERIVAEAVTAHRPLRKRAR